MNHRPNHFDTLKLARDAPTEVVRAAYKALSQRYHPDRNAAPEAAEIMCSLNLAYSILSDPLKRQEYEYELALARHKSPAGTLARRTNPSSEDYWPRGRTRARRRQRAVTRFSLLMCLVFSSAVAAVFIQSEHAYALSMGTHEQSFPINAAHYKQSALQISRADRSSE
jgi:curved DNA-binding protein CbpA